MEKRQLTCVRCTRGCRITVEIENDEAVDVYGNNCMRGEIYARSEVKDPRRVVTTTVRVEGGADPVVPVKTNGDIPKGKMEECVVELKNIVVTAPLNTGDVVCTNVADTGVDVVTTGSVGECSFS